MDTNPPIQQSAESFPAPPGILGTKRPSTIAFGVAVLLFLMPFIDIKCNNMTLKKVSGLQLATGFKMDNGMGTENRRYSDEPGRTTTVNKNTKREAGNKFALAALLLGVTGLLLSFANARTGGTGGMITGILSAISLIALFIDIKRKAKLKIPGEDEFGREMGNSIEIRVDFAIAFYLALAAFLAAVYFSRRRRKAMMK